MSRHFKAGGKLLQADKSYSQGQVFRIAGSELDTKGNNWACQKRIQAVAQKQNATDKATGPSSQKVQCHPLRTERNEFYCSRK